MNVVPNVRANEQEDDLEGVFPENRDRVLDPEFVEHRDNLNAYCAV